MADKNFKGKLRLEGLKFLSKLSVWIDLASVLKFNVDFQYGELNIKFEEKKMNHTGAMYIID